MLFQCVPSVVPVDNRLTVQLLNAERGRSVTRGVRVTQAACANVVRELTGWIRLLCGVLSTCQLLGSAISIL